MPVVSSAAGGDWICSLCSQKNSAAADKCVTCQRARGFAPGGHGGATMISGGGRPSPLAAATMQGQAVEQHPAAAPVTEQGLRRRPLGGRLSSTADHKREDGWRKDEHAPAAASGPVAWLSGLLSAITFVLTCARRVRLLSRDEQLRIQSITGVSVVNGPGFRFVGLMSSSTVVKAETLGLLDYIKIKDILDGSEKVERGPKLYFRGPYEQVSKRGQGLSLTSTQYVFIEDLQSGTRRVQRGPCVWIPGPREEGEVREGIVLSSTEYVLVEDMVTGQKRVDTGPGVWFPGPMEQGHKGDGIKLSSTDCVNVLDRLTGERRVDKGPCVWFPGPHDEWELGTSISLSCTEYISVLDKLSGRRFMVKGPCIWFPGPYDQYSSVSEAIPLQDDEFVKVKDMATGRRWIERGQTLLHLEPTWRLEGKIQKAWMLKGRAWARLHVAPRLSISSGSRSRSSGAPQYGLAGSSIAGISSSPGSMIGPAAGLTPPAGMLGGPGAAPPGASPYGSCA
eukprot:TRINITY_DN59580_c0_g2_i1.p1 TRINITY_DN59580_c0_g2~~TRINITY_DN59580_c0_g2_i1.p1  ORF type:complete len:507 (-),score=52.58 TRINITY_DN59580_c0_g2_i1:326-1846(-)